MRVLVSIVLLWCFFVRVAVGQSDLPEDCVDAQILVDVPTNLTDIAPITIDSLEGSGDELAELRALPPEVCGPHGYFPKAIDKSYWIAFSAVTDGTLEFIISPENDGTDYDFAFFEGFCPNDQCSQPIFCNYLPYLCIGTAKTGVVSDPAAFGITESSNEIHTTPLNLKAGFNYYLLVENRNEEGALCPDEDPNAGFTIEFGGTARVDKLLERPTVDPLFPADTSQTLFVCEGDVLDFAVTKVPNATIYDWTSMSIADAIITPTSNDGDSVTVQFGQSSGKICMDMVCPIQSTICWDVVVDVLPDLEPIPNATTACEPVDLTTRFQDNKNTVGALAFFDSEADALANTNPLSSNFVNVGGDYWARKTTPNGCLDVAMTTVLSDNVSITVPDTFRICNQNFANLRDEMPIENASNDGVNLVLVFYTDSLEAINRTNPFTPPVAFDNGTYWVRAEKQDGSPCFDLQSFEFVREGALEIATIPTQERCGGECFRVADLPLLDNTGNALSGLNVELYATLDGATSGDETIALGDELCTSGTYWIRAESSAACFDTASFELRLFPAPDVDDFSLTLDCQSGCINLNSIGINENNNIPTSQLRFDYFTNLADAEDPAATPMTDLTVCELGTIYLRAVNTANGCSDVAVITVEGMPLATATFSDDLSICRGDNTALEVTLTGDSPFNIQYTDGTNIFDTFSSSTIFRAPVSPDTTTIYRLVSITDGNGCAGRANDSITVSVNNGGLIENLSQDCATNATEYTLSFDIVGDGTYGVQGVAGTLTGNAFESELIPSGEIFTIEITNSDGCPSNTLPIAFSCECNSQVDEMDLQPINVCDRAPAIGAYLGPGGENLEKEDVRVFVLHDSPTNTLGNVIDFKDVAIFTFDASTMQHGVTYYMSAVVTKEDLLGSPILNAANNPCMSVSEGAPVIFYPVPEVSLSQSATEICQGESVEVTFNITGVGPYDVVFFDGTGTGPLMGISDGHTMTVSPEFSTSFYVQSISQSGVLNCDDTPVRSDTELNLTVFETPRVQDLRTSCNQEGTMLVLTFDIISGDQATYQVNGLSGNLKGNEFTSDSIPHNTSYSIEVSDANGCSPMPTTGTAECFCTADIAVNITTVKEVSCRGEADGILMANPVNGEGPYDYFWSNGMTSESIGNLAPGIASVTMTDANGCQVVNSTTLAEPTPIIADINAIDISCFGEEDGGIFIFNVTGGTGNYTYSFNDGPFQSQDFRDGFDGGIYPVAVRDDNGCEWQSEVTLADPPQLFVTLGGNATLNLGESLTLRPQINQDVTSLIWEGNDSTLCADCPEPVIQPETSQRYKVTVTNNAGCVASDQILVQVQNQRRIFIPSVFSPNGDGTNEVLRPFSGSEVEEIGMFRIFNRWGELVYEQKDMPMNDGLAGWDGRTTTGQQAPPGVYLYYLEVAFKNDTEDVITGDVTLIR
ncbi:MAG: gliding motility-associated C-terminal domain-containing protein [Bacteroidota bacterium]